MKKRLILVLDDKKVTPAINQGILNLLKQEGAGYWHWYQHAWLITDPHGRTADWWREKMKEIEPRPAFLIFALDDDRWSGFTQKKHYEWLYQNWKKESPPSS